jgi:aromatic ring-cleaving dioxygenase
MAGSDAAYHAHIYYASGQRAAAAALHSRLIASKESGELPRLLFVGELRDRKVGPHPVPQFEIHFTADALPPILPVLEASGLTILVHPLTDDDLADHTTLAHWIGRPLDLDLTTLDPPGMNQGIARFAKSDF